MKIIVFSDSHGKTALMHHIVIKEKCDMVLHLGDCYQDMLELKECYDIPIHGVVGNVDRDDGKTFIKLSLMNKTIVLCHGHNYRVKSSLEFLKTLNKDRQADLILFGHTHEAYLEENTQILMNPGSISMPRYSLYPSYGRIELSDEHMICEIIYVK